MFRVKSPSQASSRSLTGTARSRCFGVISSRVATLLLALFGLIAHMQTFKHLEVLYDSFPQIPHTRNGVLPVSPLISSLAEHKYANGRNGPRPSVIIRPSIPADVVLDSEMNGMNNDQKLIESGTQTSKSNENVYSSSNNFAPVPSPTSDSTGSSTVSKAKSVAAAAAAMSSEDLIAMVKPTRWFNMLPTRPGEEKVTPEEAAIWRAQLKDQDEERKSWEAARILTTIMRFYSIASALACLFGVYGVLKSNLLATRLFFVSSFIDLFLLTLSVMSLCVIVTYPEVRAMLCEQISSGELHSLLNYMRVTDPSSSSSSSFDASTTDASIALSDPANTVLPAANFISRSASALWKRASVSDGNNGNSSNHVYWWDMLIDDMLENESCDDIFLSVLVPISLFVCLAYIAVRIHFLIVIRAYYTSLIRQAVGLYLEPSHVVNKNAKEHLSPHYEKGRKYSTSSSSSSTIVEMGNSRSNAFILSEKALNEKLA